MPDVKNNFKSETMIMVPRSILYKTLKDAFAGRGEESIEELADILYTNIQHQSYYDKRLEENSLKIDQQHQDIVFAVNSMKEGFQRADKRFDDLIHQMDKRFAQVDKRFTFQTWLIGIGFVSINTLVVILKLFG